MISTELITSSRLKIAICCCYRQPNAEQSWIEKFNLYITQLSPRYSNILICGDFNFPKIRWKSPTVTSSGTDEIQFIDQLDDFYLTQLNTLPTRGSNVLDLVITNIPNQVGNISKLDRTESGLFTEHDTIVFNLKTSIKEAPKLNRTVSDYRRGDIDGLRVALDMIDFSSIFETCNDINNCWNQWRDNLLPAVDQHIPTKKIKGRDSPPWMNGNIIQTIKKKEAARRKLKSSPTDALRTRFKELRATVKKMVKKSRASLFNSLDSTFQSNLKRFWSIFKLNNKQTTIPNTMSMNSTYGTTK